MNGDNIEFGGIGNVAQLFGNVPSDAQVAKLLKYDQFEDLARIVGAEYKPRAREVMIVGAIRERFDAGDIIVPECKCAGLGEGRRWMRSDELHPVTYGMTRAAALAFDGAENYIHESFQFVASLAPRLFIEPVAEGEVPNIMVEYGPYDGPGNTLGVTSYYIGDDDDLDVFDARRTAVRILMDSNERWTTDYFRTVFRHEVLHAMGLGHADVRNDLMYAYYLGVRLSHPGDWSQNQMDRRYKFNAAA